jgi:Amino acid transporters
MLATFALAFFMSIFILYGFDTAGTFGEETIDASRQAPRGILSSVWISGAVGVVFLLAIILSLKDIPATMADGLAGAFPIASTIQDNLSSELFAGITVGEIYLFVILVSVFVCTLAIQGAATRMMFSMGRDRHLPLGRAWGHVSPTFRTPANASVAVGFLAAIPILLVGPIGGITLSIAATGLIYLSYFLCNLGVAVARRGGWPRKKAWFNLGRWGMPINILALIWGAVMLINIGLWASPDCSATSAEPVAGTGTRSSTACSRSTGRSSRGCPRGPCSKRSSACSWSRARSTTSCPSAAAPSRSRLTP